jgi:hypothetical protein
MKNVVTIKRKLVAMGAGRAMVQAISHRHLTVEAQVRSHSSPFGGFARRVALGRCFLPSTSVLQCEHHSTDAPQTVHVSFVYHRPYIMLAVGSSVNKMLVHWSGCT